MAAKEHNASSFSLTPLSQDVHDENRLLRETISQLKNEVDKYRTPALMLAEVTDILNENAVIRVPNGNKFLVEISSSIKNLKPGDTVAVEQKNLTVVERLKAHRRFNVEQFVILDRPEVQWEDIGGLERQKQEIIEVVELPIKCPELFVQVGIDPPKGILLYGPPGNGKTLLAKAVAASTNSYFIQVVGSELVQKFIGEGAKLVREIFELAKQNAPSIIYIDELDALAARRVDLGTSGEREVQRTFMQFLAEVDGFKPLGNVKVIGATNRLDILDPAIVRPGRLDRLIKIANPDKDGMRQIFRIHTRRMSIDSSIDTETLVTKMLGFSGAEIKSVCTEAGYMAIRERRMLVNEHDFSTAIKKVLNEEELEGREFLQMYG